MGPILAPLYESTGTAVEVTPASAGVAQMLKFLV